MISNNGTESLPGLPWQNMEAPYDAELEQQFPGLHEVFDGFLGVYVPDYIFDGSTNNRRDFPIEAAIVVPDPGSGVLEVVAAAINSPNRDQDSLDHAELVAIRKALIKFGKHLPAGSILLSMVEPCSMCTSGFRHAEGSNVIYGARQEDLRDKSILVNGIMKPFRAEPVGYSTKAFLKERDPQAKVVGDYRRSDVLNFMLRGLRPVQS